MSVFVGRARELEWLQERLDRTLAGRGGVVFVTGEAGTGKSSLIERFLLDAALQVPDARVISAECSEQYGAGEPYQPFVEALRDLVAGGEGDRPGKPRLRELARELAPHWLAAIPVAGDIIAATAATAVELKEAMGGGTATAAPPSEEALFFQYTELLLSAATEHPILLSIDDLHWADRASVSLLAHVVRRIEDRPVLIMGTYRPADVEVSKHPIREARLELERYGLAEQLELTSLDSDSLLQLIEEELGSPPMPELRNWLERRAGSNPLFFTELLKWLVDNGYAVEREEAWTLSGRPDEIEIPRSAESAIEKRLTRLDPEIYRVLEYASVEGNEFNSVVLARLLDMDELELEEALEPVARVHRLVRLEETRDLPNGDLASVYEFSHSLFQDVLHKNLQGKRRILLHRKVAQILEEIYAADIANVVHRLATHYDEGRQPEQAYDYALQAADRASRVYAHWDAIELLQRALSNAGDEPEKQIEVWDRLGEENRRVGHLTESLAEFRAAITAAQSLGWSARALSLKRKRIMVERHYGERSARDLLKQLEELATEARELDDERELCEILWSFRYLPEVPGLVDHAREALRIAEELGEPTLVAQAHLSLGTAIMLDEDPRAALPELEQALSGYEELENKEKIGACQNMLGIIRVLLGDYRAAGERFHTAAELFDEIGDPVSEALVRNNLGPLLTRAGEWEAAEENLREAVRLFKRLDATARLVHPLENLSDLYELKGDWERAAERWNELLECARETGYETAEIIALCGLASVALENNDLEAAEAHYESARELLKEDDRWTESQVACTLVCAKLAAARGDQGTAIEVLRKADSELEDRDPYLRARSQLLQGEILSRTAPADAVPIIQEALDTFVSFGAEPLRRRAELLLNELKGE